QADLYESLELLLLWRIGPRANRSRMRLPVRKPYFHREPLLRRGDIDLALELHGPPLPVTQLSKPETRKMLDLILDTSAMRYRELYGFTHPDAQRVFRADAGRGVEIVFFGHRRTFAIVDIVQNCLAFPVVRSDPCHDRAARGTKDK